MIALFTWNGFWTIVLLPYSTGHPPQLTAVGLFELLLGLAILKLRAGRLRQASWIYLAGVWLFATLVIAQNNGIHSPVLALYITLPVSAAWLLGYKQSLWTSGACLGSALGFATIEILHVPLPHTIPGTAIGIWIQLTGATLMCVMPLGQVLRALRDALAKVKDQCQTLQHRADQLRVSEERFRTLADTAPVMICIADRDKSVHFFNRAWLNFRGRTMEQESGFGWREGLHPNDQVPFDDERFEPALDGSRTFECRFRGADGEYRPLLFSVVRQLDRSGDIAGYVGSATDVTDYKRAHEQAFAGQKLETLGMFASGVAHDFNNILGGIMAQAELALTDLSPGGATSEAVLKTIAQLSFRGSSIVRELLVYAGGETETLADVDLSASVEDMAPLLKTLVSKRVKLVLNLSQDSGRVRANPAEIRRIIMNLVTNASDAIGDHDGVIQVHTSRIVAPQGSFFVQNPEEGEYVRLGVSDDGCGIAVSDQSRIFDPFFTTKVSERGRGLGLAIVSAIVRRLGGTIHLTSEPDRGSTFEVILPTVGSIRQPAGKSLVHPAKASKQQDGTVLVVEDEDALRQPISKMLRKSGFTVIEASDGSAALAHIQQQDVKIDAVLLDVTLPGTPSRDVFEACMRLRPETKIIVTSAYSENVASEKLGQRPQFFLRKPFTLGSAVESIRREMSRE